MSYHIISSQQDKIHAHSFALRLELGIQCTYTYVRNSEHHRIQIRYTYQVRKNSLNIKFLGGIFPGHPGPRRRDIPDKNFMQVAFFCGFRQGGAGMSRDLGRDVPDLEKLYAGKLWADFSYPNLSPRFSGISLIADTNTHT